MASKSLPLRRWKRKVQEGKGATLLEDELAASSRQTEMEVELSLGSGGWTATYYTKSTGGGKPTTSEEKGPLKNLKIYALIAEAAEKFFTPALLDKAESNPTLMGTIVSVLFGDQDDIPDLKFLIRTNPNENNRVTRFAVTATPDRRAEEKLKHLLLPAVGVLYSSISSDDTEFANQLGDLARKLVGTGKGGPLHKKLLSALIQKAEDAPSNAVIDEVYGESAYGTLAQKSWDTVLDILKGLREDKAQELGAVAALLIKKERSLAGQERVGQKGRSDSFTHRVATIVAQLLDAPGLNPRFALEPESYESQVAKKSSG